MEIQFWIYYCLQEFGDEVSYVVVAVADMKIKFEIEKLFEIQKKKWMWIAMFVWLKMRLLNANLTV